MAEVEPDESDVWQQLEKILGTVEGPTDANHKPTDSSDESSHAKTEPVMRSKAATDKQKAQSLPLTHNCVSNDAFVPNPVQESYDELLKLVRCMGFKLQFEEGIHNIQSIHNAMQADSNLDMTANIRSLNPKKALLCFKVSMNKPYSLSLITAKVLAKIAFFLARSYEQWKDALSFCDQAHLCFQSTPDISTELMIEQALNCSIGATSCQKMMQTFSAQVWADRAFQLLRKCGASTSDDRNVLRKVGMIYNDCASCYYNAGNKENARTCLEMAYNVYRITDSAEGMQVVRLNIQKFWN